MPTRLKVVADKTLYKQLDADSIPRKQYYLINKRDDAFVADIRGRLLELFDIPGDLVPSITLKLGNYHIHPSQRVEIFRDEETLTISCLNKRKKQMDVMQVVNNSQIQNSGTSTEIKTNAVISTNLLSHDSDSNDDSTASSSCNDSSDEESSDEESSDEESSDDDSGDSPSSSISISNHSDNNSSVLSDCTASSDVKVPANPLLSSISCDNNFASNPIASRISSSRSSDCSSQSSDDSNSTITFKPVSKSKNDKSNQFTSDSTNVTHAQPVADVQSIWQLMQTSNAVKTTSTAVNSSRQPPALLQTKSKRKRSRRDKVISTNAVDTWSKISPSIITRLRQLTVDLAVKEGTKLHRGSNLHEVFQRSCLIVFQLYDASPSVQTRGLHSSCFYQGCVVSYDNLYKLSIRLYDSTKDDGFNIEWSHPCLNWHIQIGFEEFQCIYSIDLPPFLPTIEEHVNSSPPAAKKLKWKTATSMVVLDKDNVMVPVRLWTSLSGLENRQTTSSSANALILPSVASCVSVTDQLPQEAMNDQVGYELDDDLIELLDSKRQSLG